MSNSCFCIKNYSYNITNNTCKRIIYQDISEWINVPETYEIRIKYPGGSNFITITAYTNYPTIINSIILGLSTTEEVNLPAGVYCIEVTNCNGDIFKMDFLNTCIYECELANLLASVNFLNCSDNKADIEKYKEIKLLIEGAHGKFHCNWCSLQEVKDILDIIAKKLKTISSNCKCI